MSKFVIGAISATALFLHGCGGGGSSDTTPAAPSQSIAELATSSNLTTLVTALKAAGLAGTFANATAGPFTVFAPTDEAFAELGDIVTCLVKPENKDMLTSVLEFHVHSGEVLSSALTNDESVTTLLKGKDLTVTIDGTSVTINPGNASVVAADNMASNGVVHVVDHVLVPVDFDLGDCTPPAPTPAPMQTIAELADASGLKTLVAALTAADLASTFADAKAGPFTVFAPTDDAFAALNTPELNLVECLVKPTNKDVLTSVLDFHVHSGAVLSTDLTNDMEVSTLLKGEDLTVTIDGDSVMINPGNATVVTADAEASNGVVHVIDHVLVPPTFKVPDNCAPAPAPPAPTQSIAELADASGLKTLVAALTAADLASTFADAKAGPFTVFAPTDDAFAALNTPELNLVECLVKPANKDVLTSVLEFHVHSGAVLSADLTNDMEVSTLLKGEDLTVTIDGDSVMINPGDATVVTADAEATNGVVHVIDHVLVPASFAVPDNCNSKSVLV